MSTKFVSKNSNYMIVLKPGVEGNRALGTHSISGLYIRFQAGVVDVKEDAIIEQLRNHPSFGIDFVEVKHEEIDPYLEERQNIEPAHVMTEIKYGHAEALTKTGAPVKLSPQLKKIIEQEALNMLPGLLKSNPKILKDLILGLAADMKGPEVETPKDMTSAPTPIEEEIEELGKVIPEVKEEVVVAKKPGRPAKK